MAGGVVMLICRNETPFFIAFTMLACKEILLRSVRVDIGGSPTTRYAHTVVIIKTER